MSPAFCLQRRAAGQGHHDDALGLWQEKARLVAGDAAKIGHFSAVAASQPGAEVARGLFEGLGAAYAPPHKTKGSSLCGEARPKGV